MLAGIVSNSIELHGCTVYCWFRYTDRPTHNFWLSLAQQSVNTAPWHFAHFCFWRSSPSLMPTVLRLRVLPTVLRVLPTHRCAAGATGARRWTAVRCTPWRPTYPAATSPRNLGLSAVCLSVCVSKIAAGFRDLFRSQLHRTSRRSRSLHITSQRRWTAVRYPTPWRSTYPTSASATSAPGNFRQFPEIGGDLWAILVQPI